MVTEVKAACPWWADPGQPTYGTQYGTAYLRDYQVTGANWLDRLQRAMNSDDPGLGKTIQAAYAAEMPVLIICPNNLVQQWYEWLVGIDEKTMERNKALRDNWLASQETDDWVGALPDNPVIPNVVGKVVIPEANTYADKANMLRDTDADWMIINYESLSSHEELLVELAAQRWWRTLILDESHHMRNHSAKRARTCRAIAFHMERVYELTATPVWKEVDDLFMQLSILRPDVFKSYKEFLDLYCVFDTGRFGTKVLGVKDGMADELRETLEPIRIGRDYKAAGRQLPEVIEKYVKVTFPKEMQDRYDETVADWIAVFGEGEEQVIRFENFSQILNGLRLLTRFPGKFAAAADVIEEALHPRLNLADATYALELTAPRKPARVVVFCWYKETAEDAVAYFNEHIPGAHAAFIHGGTPMEDRRPIAFDPKNNIIVATIMTLTEGIDLSDARTVVYLEEHYTPGANEQSRKRVQRERVGIGADNSEPVLVYYVHVKGTIDEHIHRVSRRRAGTIREVIVEALGL